MKTNSIMNYFAVLFAAIGICLHGCMHCKCSSADKNSSAVKSDVTVPVIKGGFDLVYEPDANKPNSWMVNDHCFIQDANGLIHYFGIENPYPTTEEAIEGVSDELKKADRPFIKTLHAMMHGHLYRAGTHYRVGHAVAKNIRGTWKRMPAALEDTSKKTLYGSPFVVYHDTLYWMFVPTLGSGIFTSSDLLNWQPVTDATAWDDPNVFGPAGHRDPCIIKLDDGTFLQYFAGADSKKRHTVNVAASVDLKHWKRLEPCYIENLPAGTPSFFGIFESPFVYKKGDTYYLFVGFSHRHYYETFVIASKDPYHFSPSDKITTVFSHAPELIDVDGKTYMSSCGIEDPQMLNRSGIWIAKIQWLKNQNGAR